jgi:hypothetical protein
MMPRIEFADGTFTTREKHEVDPHQAIPEGAVLVDHGPVITTGLQPDLPKAPLGTDFMIPESVEVVEPENKDKVEEGKRTSTHRAGAKPRASTSKRTSTSGTGSKAGTTTSANLHPQNQQRPDAIEEAEHRHDDDRSHLSRPQGQMEHAGSVPQGRIGMETSHAAPGRDSPGHQRSGDNAD